MDVCRTLAHELVHYKQDLDNELEDDDAGSTGSPQEKTDMYTVIEVGAGKTAINYELLLVAN